MSEPVSSFGWEIHFVTPQENSEELDWTAAYETLGSDSFRLLWTENPVFEQFNNE
jgi:hypothetical protein